MLTDTAAAEAAVLPVLVHDLQQLFRGTLTVAALPRTSSRLPDGTWFGVSAAVSPSLGVASTKSGTEIPTADGAVGHSLLSLIDLASGRVIVAMEAEALTAIRVAAATVAMAQLAGCHEPRRIAIVGTGVLATAHLRAVRTMFASTPVAVWGRRRERACAMLVGCGANEDGRTVVCHDAESAVRDADLVVTATSAAQPFVRAAWLAADAFVAGVGAHDAHTAELEPAVFTMAARVLTDRDGTCGVAAAVTGDTSRRGWTVWQSSGSADQDLVAGWHVWKRCSARTKGHAHAGVTDFGAQPTA